MKEKILFLQKLKDALVCVHELDGYVVDFGVLYRNEQGKPIGFESYLDHTCDGSVSGSMLQEQTLMIKKSRMQPISMALFCDCSCDSTWGLFQTVVTCLQKVK